MDNTTLIYRRNTDPSRGLAATGIFFIKFILALPHLMVVSVLSNVASLLAYIGFWVVAFTGKMPQATSRLLDISFNWSVRAWAWTFGLDDTYPPFETDPEYSASFPVTPPEEPSKAMVRPGPRYGDSASSPRPSKALRACTGTPGAKLSASATCASAESLRSDLERTITGWQPAFHTSSK